MLSQDQIIFRKGKEKIEKEMNMATILQTIQKLKAAVSVMVGQDEAKKWDIQKLYLKK